MSYKKAIVILLAVFVLLCLPLGGAFAQEDEELETYLVDYIEPDAPGIVVYINMDGETWSAAVGLADLEAETPVELDDLFRIGSITKTFVATLTLQLVDEGLVDLDTPIAVYLPDDAAANVANANTATVRQVLNMTSGIFDYTMSDVFDDATFDDPTYPWTAAEVITYSYGEAPDFAPGEDYNYSNSNYILLQLLIEGITGQSLADELQTRIFAPLEMASCFLEDPANLGASIVHGYGYMDDDDILDDMTFTNDGVGLGDGGIICAAADLAKFPRALLTGDLLSDDALAAMLDYVDDSGDGYGLGIGAITTEYGVLIGHDGATSGFQSDMVYLPDEDLVIVVLTNNFDSDLVEDLTFDALDYALYD